MGFLMGLFSRDDTWKSETTELEPDADDTDPVDHGDITLTEEEMEKGWAEGESVDPEDDESGSNFGAGDDE